MILSKFGINLYAISKRKKYKGIRKSIRTYELTYNDTIIATLKCGISENSNKYEKSFIDFVNSYNNNEPILTSDSDKIHFLICDEG